MSQLSYKINDKLGKTVHKIIFVIPSEREIGKVIEICQRYGDVRKREVKVGTNAFPFNPNNWKRQSGNRFIHYKDWNECVEFQLFKEKGLNVKTKVDPDVGELKYVVSEVYEKPDKKILQTSELGANKVAQVAQSIVAGAALNVGWILAVALLVAGIMGGALLGYFGFPAVQGQHLVPNSTPLPQVR